MFGVIICASVCPCPLSLSLFVLDGSRLPSHGPVLSPTAVIHSFLHTREHDPGSAPVSLCSFNERTVWRRGPSRFTGVETVLCRCDPVSQQQLALCYAGNYLVVDEERERLKLFSKTFQSTLKKYLFQLPLWIFIRSPLIHIHTLQTDLNAIHSWFY